MCILEFIAENHKKVVTTYEYLIDNENKWYKLETKKEYKRSDIKLKKITNECVNSEESTEEDSDDEWI